MKKLWTDRGWADYLYWQTQDKKTLRKINQLITDIERNGYTGIGKPEPLRNDLSGWWSRQIDDKNRIVYRLKTVMLKYLSAKGITTTNKDTEQPQNRA